MALSSTFLIIVSCRYPGNENAIEDLEAFISSSANSQFTVEEEYTFELSPDLVMLGIIANPFLQSRLANTQPKPNIVPRTKKIHAKGLSSFRLDQINLIGVISDDEKPIAILQTPDHEIHVVSRDARVGQDRARVLRVESEKIILKGGHVITIDAGK